AMPLWRYKRALHPSWLWAGFFFGVASGVVPSFRMPEPFFVSFAWCVCGGILAGICLVRRYLWLAAIMVVAGSLVGLWRGSSYRQQLEPYNDLVGKSMTLSGTVREDPDTGDHGE